MATPVSRVSVLAVFLTVIVLLEISSTYAQQVFTTPGSCSSLGAVNGLTPQPNANSPYVMQIAPQYYTTGTIITVTVYANQPAGRSLREFIIQARDTATNSPVGTFTRVNGNPLNTNEYIVYNCGATGSTVGTTSNNVKFTPVVFTYQAGPASGNIAFRCSFLQDTGILYQSLASQQVVNQANVAGPVINNCPGDIFLPSSQDTMTSRPFVSVEWTEPTSIGVGVNNPVNPNALIQIGSEAVLLTYTFRSGDSSSTCSFNVVVNDDETTTANTAPVLSGCPVGTVNSFTTPPTCNDAEQGGLAVTCNPPAGSPFQAGTTTAVACSCSDNLGSSDVCTFNVFLANPCSGSPCLNGGTCTVFGNTFQCTCVGGFSGNVCQTPPVDPCTNVVCQNGGTCITDGVIFVCICIPTFTGTFCEVPVPNPCSGSPCLNGGTCTVFGNTFQCTCVGGFSGNICQTPPVDPCTNVVCQNGGTCITNGVIFICVCIPTFSGTFCEVPANPCSGSPCLNGGTCTVFGDTFQCTCVGGFSGNVCQTPINTSPTFQSCPDVTANAPPGSGSTDVSYTLPFCLDTQDIFLISTCNPLSGTTFPVGSTDVTCVCTDSGLLSTSCTFQVQVNSANNAPELFGCPVGTVNSFTIPPTCNDAEQGALAVNCNPPAGSTFQAGTTTAVACVCTDNLGSSDVCTFNVFVANPCIGSPCLNGGTCTVFGNTFQCTCVEGFSGNVCQTTPNTAPVLSGCPVGTVNSFTTSPTCNDAEQGTLAVTCNPPAGSTFQAGTTTAVTCVCSDNLGSSDFCTFNVFVAVNSPPQIGPCPTINSIVFGMNQFFLQFTTPSCTDPNGDAVTVTCNPAANSIVANVPGVITCTCRDSSEATSVVTCPVNQPPTVQCPAAFSVTAPPLSTSTTAPFNTPQCVDNQQANFLATCTPSSGSLLNAGQNTVVCTCQDSGGLTDSCTFMVTVLTVNSPPQIGSCPMDFNSFAFDNQFFLQFTTPSCTDPDRDAVTVTCNPAASSIVDIIPSYVNCTCTDSSQATDSVTCKFDTEPPTIVVCPSDQVVTVLTGSLGGVVNFPTPQAQDNSGFVVLANNPQFYSGFYFPLGMTTVTYVFRDAVPLTVNCTFMVTVNTASPCDSSPCFNGGVCLAVDNSRFWCVCPGCFIGDTCSFSQDPCTNNNQCLNGGQCRVYPGSCTQTFCECQPCFTGANCQISSNPCDNNQCGNGGVCVPSTTNCDSYTCFCSGCQAGPFCQGVFDPCSRFPCLNGGACTNIAESCTSYSCQCTGCFTGYNCQTVIPDPCVTLPCLNGGICTRVAGTCLGYTCNCQTGFGGVLCENNVAVVSNPCNTFPCMNDGCCVSLGNNNYKCICRNGYTGIFCGEITSNVNFNSDSCRNNPCSNGGTCYNSYNSNTNNIVFVPQYTCACPPGFVGQNCQLPVAALPQFDICTSTGVVCLNGGTCRNTYCSATNDLGVFCECPAGFLGERCQIQDVNRCSSSPCRNGGQCTAFSKFFVCSCAPGFGGTTCEVTGADNQAPVISNCPTQGVTVTANAGDDFAFVTWPDLIVNDNSGHVNLVSSNGAPGNYAVGSRNVRYVYADASGLSATCSFVVTVNEVDLCTNVVCQNGGTCFTNGVIFACQCLATFTGTFCEVPVNQPPTVQCPADFSVTAPLLGTSTTATFNTPLCVDNQQANFLATCTPSSGSPFNAGPNTVVCTCRDSGGLTDSCTFMVTVLTNTAPVLSGCPVGTVNSFTASPTCNDAEQGGLAVNCNPQAGSTFQAGTTAVTCSCSDNLGSSDVCTFNVFVAVTQTFAECPGQVTETQVGNGVVRVSFANPVCPAGQVSSCTAANNALVTSTNPVDVCCTCSSSQSQSQCCFARVFDPQLPGTFFVTSRLFPLAYPQGITQNTVVTSTVNLRATLLFFNVPMPPINNLDLVDTLSIGAGGVIGINVLNTYDIVTEGNPAVTVIGGNTLWIRFVSMFPNQIPANNGFVFQIEEA